MEKDTIFLNSCQNESLTKKKQTHKTLLIWQIKK